LVLKKVLLTLLLAIVLALLFFQAVGLGWFGQEWKPAPAVSGPRPATGTVSGQAQTQVLFGDLHNHTNYSMDAYIFNTGLVKGGGVVTPADACDFARYCSALDFWSINDHAESLTPRVWSDTLSAIRDCNAQSGDPGSPDMVSFVGWEWSNSDKKNVPSHYGHKNVVFRTWEEGATPTRPISSEPESVFAKIPALFIGLVSLVEGVPAASAMGGYFRESVSVPLCSDDVPADELPTDCREVALTPTTLFRKLDEWGFDAMVIPHGLAWGTTNPLTGNFRTQMDEHEQRYQSLLEVYSGHGSSELFEDFQRIGTDENGEKYCPEPTENFTPCCWQAGEITRQRCTEPGSAACEQEAAEVISAFVAKGSPAGRKLLENTTLGDWAGCGHLRNAFQPSSMYVPRMSAQYSLALAYDEEGDARRARFGFIGSSDGHQARPGSSYKEGNRLLYTDHKDSGGKGPGADVYKADKESGGFYYTGGLVAVHTGGRDRDALWEGLSSRNAYATSGDRMLVWFDLLNGPSGTVPMGSEVYMADTPRFRVKALGAFKQQAGCPDYARAALGEERLQSLCGGECYNPGGDSRKAITRIEVIRIRPQVQPDEKIAPLVENEWRVFECPAQGEGCEVEFEDPDYTGSQRSALYYARVIQESEPLVVGDPFGCEYNEHGQCVKRNYCIGPNAQPDMDCLAEAEPRAWTSPIFVEYQ
jgi:hypothetical protein